MPQGKQEQLSPLTAATTLLAASAIAMAVSIGVLALSAWLVAGGTLEEGWLDKGRILAAFVGCFAGAGYAACCLRKRALLTALGTGGGFLLLWLAARLALGNGAGGENPASTVISALVGAAVAGVLLSGSKKRRK